MSWDCFFISRRVWKYVFNIWTTRCKFTKALPIPSLSGTVENEGADGYGADGYGAVGCGVELNESIGPWGSVCTKVLFEGYGANGVGCRVIAVFWPNVLLKRIGYVPIVIGKSRTGSSRQQSAGPRIYYKNIFWLIYHYEANLKIIYP